MLNKAVVRISLKKGKSDWAVREFVDQSTGKIHRRYSFRGKPCKRVTLRSRLCDQLAGYALIEKDLRSALVWLRKIDELHKTPGDGSAKYHIHGDREVYNIVKGLFVAALTFYGKGFSKCEGRPVKLERVQLDEKYRDVHDVAMSFRHNFAAHSGALRLESVTIALVGLEKSKHGRQRPVNLYTELFQPDLQWTSDKEEIWYLQLFEHAREVAQKKIKFLTAKIMEEEVNADGVERFFN